MPTVFVDGYGFAVGVAEIDEDYRVGVGATGGADGCALGGARRLAAHGLVAGRGKG